MLHCITLQRVGLTGGDGLDIHPVSGLDVIYLLLGEDERANVVTCKSDHAEITHQGQSSQ
jgi:hypothetical protein